MSEPDDELWTELKVEDAASEFPRLSPPLQRFADGDMPEEQARQLGYVGGDD